MTFALPEPISEILRSGAALPCTSPIPCSVVMSAFTILAGGYDSSIAAYAFTPDNASLTLVNTYPSGQNPSWISLNPSNTSVL